MSIQLSPEAQARFKASNLPGPPPCSHTLGFELLELDIENRTARVRFEAKPEFTNPAGNLQGGFTCAMLDDAIGMLTSLVLGGQAVPSTIELNTQYLRPVRPGAVEVQSRIVSLGRTVVFAEADLYDSRGKIAARARSSLAIIRLNKPDRTEQDTKRETTHG